MWGIECVCGVENVFGECVFGRRLRGGDASAGSKTSSGNTSSGENASAGSKTSSGNPSSLGAFAFSKDVYNLDVHVFVRRLRLRVEKRTRHSARNGNFNRKVLTGRGF